MANCIYVLRSGTPLRAKFSGLEQLVTRIAGYMKRASLGFLWTCVPARRLVP